MTTYDQLDLRGFHGSRLGATYAGCYSGFDRAELEEVAERFAAAIDFAFNPRDGDGSQEALLIEAMLAAASWIQGQPCRCTPSSIEDGVPCGRCYVLNRLGDKRQDP